MDDFTVVAAGVEFDVTPEGVRVKIGDSVKVIPWRLWNRVGQYLAEDQKDVVQGTSTRELLNLKL